ncbi:DNA polymerase III subunit delta', partial [Candidatus Aminicenantes bacterium AC-334-K16]|nr:DNA polymerase III subunit delta' [Candidatus Aminicenantes bacterium AC-334-K16]
MPFDQVIGNERIKEIFRLALQKRRLPQSILLADPSGSGAEKLARVLAQAVNCLQLSDDACGICANCRAIEKGIFPDVLVIEPDKEVIKVERIREAKKLAYLKPMVGRRKVFIIQQSEKMTVEAANTFLKVLEEPPATTLFILITNNPHLLLPTIRSRCQELNLSPIPRELLEKFIQDQGRDKNEARLIAYLVKGDFEEASRFNIQETRRQREASWKLVKACVLGENFSQVIRECSSYTLHS